MVENIQKEKSWKNLNQKKILGIFVTLIISLTIIWFIFGWLYGPNPSLATIPNLVQSYFKKNSNLTSNELKNVEGELNFLKIPEDFKINLFAQNLGGPNPYIPGVNWGVRQLAVKPILDNSNSSNQKSIIYATIHKEGKVVALKDNDGDGRAESSQVFLENLSLPHGIEVYEDWIYVAENDKVSRAKDADSDGVSDGNLEKIVDLLPFLEHWTRTVRIMTDPEEVQNPDQDYLFVSIGSSCNGCIESNPWRASIIRCDLDGQNCQVYATGLRNSVDFFKYQNQIWATDTGKDFLGNDIPPEEVNLIKKGKNYGWPYCFGKQIQDFSFDKTQNKCAQTEPSFSDLPAHSTAIGVTGYLGNTFPAKYKDKLFVALHGSWQSKPPVGFQIVMVDPQNGGNQVFVDGFAGNGQTYGRPVHIVNYQNGFLISDDMSGKIYFLELK